MQYLARLYGLLHATAVIPPLNSSALACISGGLTLTMRTVLDRRLATSEYGKRLLRGRSPLRPKILGQEGEAQAGKTQGRPGIAIGSMNREPFNFHAPSRLSLPSCTSDT